MSENPLDFDGDGKTSNQETAVGIAFLVVAGGLVAYLLFLTSTGQLTEESLQPLMVVLAWVASREGLKRLSNSDTPRP